MQPMESLVNKLEKTYPNAKEAKEALEDYFKPKDIEVNKEGLWLGGLQLYETIENSKEVAATKEILLPQYRDNLIDIYPTCEKFGYVKLLQKFGWSNIKQRKDEVKAKLLLFSEYSLKPDEIFRVWCEHHTLLKMQRMLKDHHSGRARAKKPTFKR